MTFAQNWNSKTLPDAMHLQGTSYSAYSGKEKIWEIRADKVEGNGKKTKISNIHGTLYQKGKVHYYFRSSVAYMNPKTNDLFFPNGAIFNNPEGERIWMRELSWLAQDKRFIGTKGVWVLRLNTRLRGDRIMWNSAFQDFVLEGHVKADLLPALSTSGKL